MYVHIYTNGYFTKKLFIHKMKTITFVIAYYLILI